MFTGRNSIGPAYDLKGTDRSPLAEVRVNGGIFNVTNLLTVGAIAMIEEDPKTSDLAISGGAFSVKPEQKYLTDQHIASGTQNADGYYTIETVPDSSIVLAPDVTTDENATSTTVDSVPNTITGKDVIIPATTTNSTTMIESATVTISKDQTASLATAKSAIIKTDVAEVQLDSNVLDTIHDKSEDTYDVVLTVTVVDVDDVEEAAKEAIPDGAQVIDITLTINGEQVSKLDGKATITMPYAHEEDKIPAVYYIDNDGDLTSMSIESYTDTSVTFVTSHFSYYAAVAITPDDSRRAPTVDFEDNGDISPNGGSDGIISVTEGSNKTFTITAGDVDEVLFNGKEIDVEDGKFTLKNIKEDGELEVFFPDEGQPTPSNPYIDITEGTYGYEAILNLSNLGLMNGYPDGTFQSQTALSRAMVTEMLYRLEDASSTGVSTFSDVPAGMWYAEGIAWAAANGLVEGYTNGTFQPNKMVTREEMAVILYRYAQSHGLGYADDATITLEFADASSVSYWAAEAVCWCAENGLLNTTGMSHIEPQTPATRADVAIAFDALIALLAE